VGSPPSEVSRASTVEHATGPLEAVLQLADGSREAVAGVVNVLAQGRLYSVQLLQHLTHLLARALEARELSLQAPAAAR